MSMMAFFAGVCAATSSGGSSPAGAPSGMNATNNGTNFFINWTNAVSDQNTELFRDGSVYTTVGDGIGQVEIGAMVGDGTHTWKTRHISPDTEFSADLTTVDGVTDGSPPAGAPSGLSVYEYGGGTRFGIQWSNGDASASTEMYRDGSFYAAISQGVTQLDIGLKAGDGSHTWKCRHQKNGQYSAYSAEIQTLNGVLV